MMLPVLLLTMLLLAANTSEARAQGNESSRFRARVPVTLVMVQQPLPNEEPWIIERATPGSGGDRVLIDARATHEDLSDAVRSLLIARGAHGDEAPERLVLRMRRQQPATSRKTLPWIPRVHSDLASAPARHDPVWGATRSVRIFLPRQQRSVTR